MLVIGSTFNAVCPGRDDDLGVECLDAGQQACGIEGLIGDDRTHVVKSVQKVLGFGDVMPFASGQTKAGEIAQAIDYRMNLGAQSPTRTAKTLLSFFLAIQWNEFIRHIKK